MKLKAKRPNINLLGLAMGLLLAGATCARAEVTVQKDVSYLGEARAEKADIYTPSGKHKEPMPAVLVIHGGGWKTGDKADHRGVSISTDLAGQGYVVFAINYLLASPDGTKPEDRKGGFPQNVYDCKTALRYMKAHAKELGIDPKRIGILGESAGGHLVVLLGATQHSGDMNQNGLYLDQSNDVTCVVDMYGIPNLDDPSIHYIRGPFKGATEKETDANVKRANPWNYIDKTMPPTLILHGTADTTVPIAQSERLDEKLTALGVPHEFVKVPEGHHSFDLHPKEMDVRPVVFAFLKKYLQP